jgi:cell surface protein SprA
MRSKGKHLHILLTAVCLITLTQTDGSTFAPLRPSAPAHQAAPPADPAPKDTTARPRFTVKKTVPLTEEDLKSKTLDLHDPDNIKTEPVYNDTLQGYLLGSKLGNDYLETPLLLSPEEFRQWSMRNSLADYFHKKNQENFQNKGKEKFSFTDMKFDLGPAEKIFGPGGVQIKTQGTAELKFGGNTKKVDNPSLPINRRKTFGFNFDEKINLSVNGRVGDKVNMNLNYNTDATFEMDTKNLKLKYEGKEDEIVKLVEAGNISMPTNSSLITGASSLFGFRTDLQFGKLKLQAVASQKKSTSKTVSSKGGTQLTPFEIQADNYEENRHFFLSHYFREHYDQNMANLPNITSGITINRVEVWITNKTGSYENQRNVVGFTDLGEHDNISNSLWTAGSTTLPSNKANDLYNIMATQHSAARNIDQVSTELGSINNFVGGKDYEKLQSARKLSSSEYTVNTSLGYISLNTALQSDEVLAVAYEYTYGGVTYQVGEFASDITDSNQALFVKTLKNTANTPQMGNWHLMMKNVYNLGATSIQKEKFRLDIKYQSDTAGVYLTYLPEENLKSKTLLKLENLDRLDANNKPNPNGIFDFVEGYTILASKGRVIFPVAQPFGSHLRKVIGNDAIADKYCFDALYDSTKTVAKQIAEKDKFLLTGQFKGSNGAEIQLGAYNIPQGSVVVTAGGVTLTENTDYSVDYSSGVVTILNQSIIDAGTNVNVSLESQSDYSTIRKTMLGLNFEYDFSKNFTIGGTLMHLGEHALVNKVNIGEEPLNNTIWGFNMNWKKESQWLTNMLAKLPLLHCTAPSNISFTGEVAQLIAGKNKGTQGDASYLDNFESSQTGIDVRTPTSWMISSVPTEFPEYSLTNNVQYGYNRALLSWYYIDPLFTRRSSSLTPSHIKSDLNQLSNLYVREVYEREVYPNKSRNNYNSSSTLSILNLAYYPSERGPYNLDPDLNAQGRLNNPAKRWGGMMRKLETSDFESSNIEYIEFWMLDPFIYTRDKGGNYGGDFYINLGEVSEDILKDGKKFYESGLPTDDNPNYYTTTVWGRVPVGTSVTYAFNTSSGARAKQDVGLNGLSDTDEKNFDAYKAYLAAIQGKISLAAYDSIANDPAGDDYHYFRGADFDEAKMSILDRYKHINSPEGNSPESNGQGQL